MTRATLLPLVFLIYVYSIKSCKHEMVEVIEMEEQLTFQWPLGKYGLMQQPKFVHHCCMSRMQYCLCNRATKTKEKQSQQRISIQIVLHYYHNCIV